MVAADPAGACDVLLLIILSGTGLAPFVFTLF
jgi:hypothetical protein